MKKVDKVGSRTEIIIKGHTGATRKNVEKLIVIKMMKTVELQGLDAIVKIEGLHEYSTQSRLSR